MVDIEQVAIAAAANAASEPCDPSKDPKRGAKSKDPAWKYGFWPDLEKRDLLQCMLCNKRVHAGVGRLKRHLAGVTEMWGNVLTQLQKLGKRYKTT